MHPPRTPVKRTTHSTKANLYPMHARGPPKKLKICPQIPGILAMTSGGLSHRSGLNSKASSPHMCLSRLTDRIGIDTKSPFAILIGVQQRASLTPTKPGLLDCVSLRAILILERSRHGNMIIFSGDSDCLRHRGMDSQGFPNHLI